MHVVVCVKQVPDPNATGRLDPATHLLVRDGEAVLDPGDEFGIEAGLQIAERSAGSVTVLTMGPERALDALRKALAMGASKAILVSDDLLRGSDALTTAKVLAAAIRREGFDLVITATESTDGYTGVVPQQIAELLGVPSVTFAREITVAGGTLSVTRQTEVGTEQVEAELPAVVSVTAGVNSPRYPSLKGIMGAKSKPIERPSLAELGVEGLGGATAHQRITSLERAEARAAGEIIPGDGEAARRIVDFLVRSRVI